MDQVIGVLWNLLSSKHVTVPDHNRFLYTTVKFKERWNFPNVIGKHVRNKYPTKAGLPFYNYSFFSYSVNKASQILKADSFL